MGYVFISYSWEDAEIAATLVRWVSEARIDYWWDQKIPAGHAFTPPLMTAIEDASSVLLVCTRNAKRSEWVARELERAEALALPTFALQYDGTTHLAIDLRDHFDMRERQDLPPMLVKHLVTYCGTVDPHTVGDPKGQNLAVDPRNDSGQQVSPPYSPVFKREIYDRLVSAFERDAARSVSSEIARRKGKSTDQSKDLRERHKAEHKVLRRYRRHRFSPEQELPAELVALGGIFARLEKLRALIMVTSTDYFGRCASFAHCRNYIDEYRLRIQVARDPVKLERLHCRECAKERTTRIREGERGIIPKWGQFIRDAVVRDPERVKDIFDWPWADVPTADRDLAARLTALRRKMRRRGPGADAPP